MGMKARQDYIGILGYDIDFIIPGFEKSYPKGVFRCPSFSERPSQEWFLSFIDEVENAIGKRFLPIYRMSDGEFKFCVGYRYPYRAQDESMFHYVFYSFRRIVSQLRNRLRRRKFSAGGQCYISADYQQKELGRLQIRYVEQLRQIAGQGLLALHFTYRQKQFQQQYIALVTRWLDEQGIKLHEGNYCPFYFVYAMLTGPFRGRIYQGRRVLVITSYDDTKREAITKGLQHEGVVDVQFLPLSQGRAMYDKIDLSAVKRPVDMVLVGGGIGASNILCQLEPLNTVAIDVGYIIECLVAPERKKQRTFCWPDEERNEDYSPI